MLGHIEQFSLIGVGRAQRRNGWECPKTCLSLVPFSKRS